MINGSLIYLASPYSHPDELVRHERFERLLAVVAQFMNEGYLVFSPIAHSHPVAVRHDLPGDWEFWKRIDAAFISVCGAVWVLCIEGWRESKGVAAEIEIAREMGKPVYFIGERGEFYGVEAPNFI